jgi:hypothetical protein
MLKLKKGANEYEVTGHITFLNNEEVEQTNYTIVIDGVTTTVESTDSEWEVFEAPDPIIEPEPTPEPEPEPVEPVETPEEIAAAEEADAKRLWLRKKAALKEMISDMRDMQDIGATVAPEKILVIQTLATWCDANAKEAYYL